MIRRPPRSTLFPYTTLFRSPFTAPVLVNPGSRRVSANKAGYLPAVNTVTAAGGERLNLTLNRSEEHTSELQSRQYLVCRLLLEKKKITKALTTIRSTPSSRK